MQMWNNSNNVCLAHSRYTVCLQGTDLLKHGRLGKPKMHFFRLADADTHLMWRSSNGKQRSIALASVFQVGVQGSCTDLFSRVHAVAARRDCHAFQL